MLLLLRWCGGCRTSYQLSIIWASDHLKLTHIYLFCFLFSMFNDMSHADAMTCWYSHNVIIIQEMSLRDICMFIMYSHSYFWLGLFAFKLRKNLIKRTAPSKQTANPSKINPFKLFSIEMHRWIDRRMMPLNGISEKVPRN